MKSVGTLSIVLGAFALSAGSIAQAGSGSHGGDPLRLRQKLAREKSDNPELVLRSSLIRKYLGGSEVDHDLYLSVAQGRFRDLPDPEAQRRIDVMTAREPVTGDQGVDLPALLIDLRSSSLEFSESCEDENGQSVAASATMNDLGGPICVDVKRLATERVTIPELLGLLVHEEAHHFGFADEDYRVFESVCKTVLSYSPSWANFDESGTIVEPDTTFFWALHEADAMDQDTGDHVSYNVAKGASDWSMMRCFPKTPHSATNLGNSYYKEGGLEPVLNESLCRSRRPLFNKILNGGLYATKVNRCAMEIELNAADDSSGGVQLVVTADTNPYNDRCDERGKTMIYDCDPDAAQCFTHEIDGVQSACRIDVLSDGNLMQICYGSERPIKYQLIK